MATHAYFEAAKKAIDRLAAEQMNSINTASELLVNAIVGGRSLFSFGATHSFMMTEELVYRTGGLMLINPIYPEGMNLSVRPLTKTSEMERVPGLGREILDESPAKGGDVLILTSTSGRNSVIIDMALAAREKGIATIGITSLDYSRAVTSRHASGKKLMDLCDIVIDNCAPSGDAAVAVSGFAQKVGPLSSLTGIVIGNVLVARVVEELVSRGIDPPVFVSGNLDEGDAHNARLLELNRYRIHYMD